MFPMYPLALALLALLASTCLAVAIVRHDRADQRRRHLARLYPDVPPSHREQFHATYLGQPILRRPVIMAPTMRSTPRHVLPVEHTWPGVMWH